MADLGPELRNVSPLIQTCSGIGACLQKRLGGSEVARVYHKQNARARARSVEQRTTKAYPIDLLHKMLIITELDARGATLALLAARASEATLCPSEVARTLVAPLGAEAAVDWRATMPSVHAAIDALLLEGRVQLSWKGIKLETRLGPYRIGRGPHG